MAKLLKGLFRTRVKSDGTNAEADVDADGVDDKDLTLTSSVNLLQHPPRQRQEYNHSAATATTVAVSSAEQQISSSTATSSSALRNQQFPGNSSQIKHQRKDVVQVKPCEEQQTENKSHQDHNQDEPEKQLQAPLVSNNPYHNITTVRRIRRPPQWMGNYEKAKARGNLNNYRNAKAKAPSRLHPAIDNYAEADPANAAECDGEEQNSSSSSSGCRSGLLAKVRSFIIEFLQDSSIHGFVYLAKIGLNFIERYVDVRVCCLSGYPYT